MKVYDEKLNWDELLKRENARVEWKENVANPQNVVKTLCAFANDFQQVGGGRVFCGFKEEKNEYGEPLAIVVGLDEKRFKEVKNKVLDYCHRAVEPPLSPQISEYPIENDPSRRILIFAVPSSPYAHRYRTSKDDVNYYVRINDETRPANGLIPQLLERKKVWPPYLDQTHPDIVLDDIDLMALKEFLGRLELPHSVEKYLEPTIRFRGDIPDLVTFPPGNMKQAVPRNFTVLLFGREPHRFFRGAFAILSVYDGLEKDSDRSVRFEIFGPIPVLIRNLVEKLQLHMGLEIDKTADFLNGDQNRYRFSKLAVQEAIVNAFVHRDYHSYEPVRVTVFKDRIEVTSPGGSIGNLDAEQIQKGEVYTSWRNPSLAWFMVELKYAQNEGQGIRTIIQQTRKIAGKDPQFKINSDWFTVVIPAYVPIPLIIDFDLKAALSDLRVGLDELRDTLSGHDPELENELDKVEDNLNQVTGESSKEKFNKPLNDLRRLLKRLETPVSASLINSYNQLASWITGIPLLPNSPSAGKDIHI